MNELCVVFFLGSRRPTLLLDALHSIRKMTPSLLTKQNRGTNRAASLIAKIQVVDMATELLLLDTGLLNESIYL